MFTRLFTALAQLDVSPLPTTAAGDTQLQQVLGVVFTLAGAVAVLVVAYGAVRFIISRGQPAEIVKARNIIIYGLVGLVVILLAFAIVTFTIGI